MSFVTNFHALLSGLRCNAMTQKGAPVFITNTFLDDSEVPDLSDFQPYENDGYTGFGHRQQNSFHVTVAEPIGI